jgi:aconitate hydratase
MIGAGLLARKAAARGLETKPWVKTSLAPGSQVVGEYLDKSGLQKDLDKLGFNLVGFGCTTCIGNSGPLPPENSKAINDNDLVAAAVLSGNRNFEGRVNADVRANYLASPPLVVSYAIAGSMNVDLAKEPLGVDQKGKKVFLKDIWPSNKEIGEFVAKNITKQIFSKKYADVFKGDALWRKISVKGGMTYDWDKKSTYVQNPPYFVGMGRHPKPLEDIVDARVLALLLDSITTDHISPAGSIKVDSPAGKYLVGHKHAPRQPRSDDAWHFREHSHQEPNGAGGRRWGYRSLPVQAAHADLRRGDEIQGRRSAAGRFRRQGIWQRVFARLGGQGLDPSRRARSGCAVFRAHPPFESGWHGCDALGF